MGWIDIKVTKRKNGTEAAWFKDSGGRRIGTRAGTDIVKAEQLAWLANYYIELQQDQLDKGLGSNGAPMPPLQGSSTATFKSIDGRRKFAARMYRGYRGVKVSHGLPPIRDLSFTGEMRRDIRISYLDDRMAKISITTRLSRIKALANQRRAEWWGLSQESAKKFATAQASIYGGAVEDYLDSLGLVESGDYIVRLARRLNMAKRSFLRAA